jgi:hypothetical protein
VTRVSKPKEFWILDDPQTTYPTCYRSEPTWGCEPDNTGRVVHVIEQTPLTSAAPDMLWALKLVMARMVAEKPEDSVQLTAETYDAIMAAIIKAESRAHG